MNLSASAWALAQWVLVWAGDLEGHGVQPLPRLHHEENAYEPPLYADVQRIHFAEVQQRQ